MSALRPPMIIIDMHRPGTIPLLRALNIVRHGVDVAESLRSPSLNPEAAS